MDAYSPNTTTIAISHGFSVFLSFCTELYVEISGLASVSSVIEQKITHLACVALDSDMKKQDTNDADNVNGRVQLQTTKKLVSRHLGLRQRPYLPGFWMNMQKGSQAWT